MPSDANILITGGTGFVGRHLQEELRARGVPHHVFHRAEYDLTRPEEADAALAAHKDCGLIVHLASYQAAGDFPAKHPGEQFHVNTLIHTNLLEAWRRRLPGAKLVAIGTSCAYPGDATMMVEETFLTGEPHGSVYAYAFTKRLLWLGIKAYNDQFGLNGSYVIPATMYGEYDDFAGETAHVCGALIGRFVRAAREDWPEVEIWGDGTQVREFMDVKDFVPALLHLAGRCERDIVNVGPGRGTTIRALAETIARAAAYRGRLAFQPQRYVGAREKFMCADKLRREYGWEIPGDMEAGIRRTVTWYAENYEALKDRRKFGG